MNKNNMSFDNGYLLVVGIRNDVDNTGIPYKVVQFQGKKLIGKKETTLKGLVTRVFWPATYEREVNGVKTTFRGDAEFDMLNIGDVFSGGIYHCSTTPYRIGEGANTITTWKGAIFEGENPLIVAAKALRQNNAAPLYYDEELEQDVAFKLPTVAAPKKEPHLQDDENPQ